MVHSHNFYLLKQLSSHQFLWRHSIQLLLQFRFRNKNELRIHSDHCVSGSAFLLHLFGSDAKVHETFSEQITPRLHSVREFKFLAIILHPFTARLAPRTNPWLLPTPTPGVTTYVDATGHCVTGGDIQIQEVLHPLHDIFFFLHLLPRLPVPRWLSVLLLDPGQYPLIENHWQCSTQLHQHCHSGYVVDHSFVENTLLWGTCLVWYVQIFVQEGES